MSRQLNPSQVWTQYPVASRLVEVNTKTGFSLTAGSYAVLASSTQGGVINVGSAYSNTATISSVTTTRATVYYGGGTYAVAAGNDGGSRITLTNATTVTANRGTNSGDQETGYRVNEFF